MTLELFHTVIAVGAGALLAMGWCALIDGQRDLALLAAAPGALLAAAAFWLGSAI